MQKPRQHRPPAMGTGVYTVTDVGLSPKHQPSQFGQGNNLQCAKGHTVRHCAAKVGPTGLFYLLQTRARLVWRCFCALWQNSWVLTRHDMMHHDAVVKPEACC